MLAPHILLDDADFRSLCRKVVTNDAETDIVSLTTTSQQGQAGLEGPPNPVGFVMMDQDARDLAQALAQNTVVTELYINITKLSVRGAIALMPYIISNQVLTILGFQGKVNADPNNGNDDDDGEFEIEEDYEMESRQVVVADTLIRAAVQNKSCLTLELQSCSVARSSLRVCVQPDSLLSEINMGDNCQMIADDEDPLYDELSYSTKLQEVSIVHSNLDRGLSTFLFQCCIHLPCLQKIFLRGNINVSLALTKVYGLRDFVYMNDAINDNPEAISSIANYIENADGLNRAFFHLSNLSESQTDELRLAFRRNRSLTHVWQSPKICKELSKCCRRNAAFLMKWQDLKTDFPASLFPAAAEVAMKSNSGRSSLYLRLPQVLSREL